MLGGAVMREDFEGRGRVGHLRKVQFLHLHSTNGQTYMDACRQGSEKECQSFKTLTLPLIFATKYVCNSYTCTCTYHHTPPLPHLLYFTTHTDIQVPTYLPHNSYSMCMYHLQLIHIPKPINQTTDLPLLSPFV